MDRKLTFYLAASCVAFVICLVVAFGEISWAQTKSYANAGPSEDGCSCTTEGTGGCATGVCNHRKYCTDSKRKAAGCGGYDCSAYGGQALAWTVCDNSSSSGLPTCTSKGSYGYFCRKANGQVATQWLGSGACGCSTSANCLQSSSGAVCSIGKFCRNSLTGAAAGCSSSSSSSSGAIVSSSGTGVSSGSVVFKP